MKTHSDVEGYLAFKDFYLHVADGLRDGMRLAEVGVFQGRSAIFLGEMIRDKGVNVEFYAIDSWRGTPTDQTIDGDELFNAFMRNLHEAEMSKWIIPIRLASVAAAREFPDGYFDLVFIDACHEYEAVKADIAAWLPKVKPGGIIAGDDFIPLHPGVILAAEEAFGDRLKLDKLPAWYSTV